MYDKVKFWLERSAIGGGYSKVADFLTMGVEQVDRRTGEIKVFGSLDGLKVSVFCSGISIIGSLSKYMYGNNIYPLDRHTTKEALDRIGKTFHVDMNKAKVTGLEFGTVFLLKHKIPYYLQRLGDMPKLDRCRFEEKTLYYQSKSKEQPKTLAFYDKIEEQRKSGATLPAGFDRQNILKYELRLNQRLPKQLNVKEVNASTLYDEEFFRMLVRLWQNYYFQISKQQQTKNNSIYGIRTVKDAFNMFIAQIMANSDKDTVNKFIDDLKYNRVFADRKNYSRLKNKLQNTFPKVEITETDEAVKELDDAVKNASAYL